MTTGKETLLLTNWPDYILSHCTLLCLMRKYVHKQMSRWTVIPSKFFESLAFTIAKNSLGLMHSCIPKKKITLMYTNSSLQPVPVTSIIKLISCWSTRSMLFAMASRAWPISERQVYHYDRVWSSFSKLLPNTVLVLTYPFLHTKFTKSQNTALWFILSYLTLPHIKIHLLQV